jgi:hypothetical protein
MIVASQEKRMDQFDLDAMQWRGRTIPRKATRYRFSLLGVSLTRKEQGTFCLAVLFIAILFAHQAKVDIEPDDEARGERLS